MKRRLFAAAAVILAIPLGARGNFGGYEAGNAFTGNVLPLSTVEDTFRPSGLSEIEMQDEWLHIVLHIETADVEVKYTLRNPTGKMVEVVAGFPSASQPDAPDSMEPPTERSRDTRDVTDYHLFVDEEEVPWKLEFQPRMVVDHAGTRDDNYSQPNPFWFVSKLSFKPGESHAVRIRYRAAYRSAAGGISGDDEVSPTTLKYQFSTAAGWKGPINKGHVLVEADTADANVLKFRPDGRFKRTDRSFIWDFTDLKPTLADDLTIQISEAYHTFQVDEAVKKDRPAGVANEQSGQYEVHPGRASYWISKLFSVTATSLLDPKKFGPENVAEYDNDRPWAEGVAGDGLGEGLDLSLRRPTRLYQVGIVNGYAKSADLYEANNRVAELGVSLNGEKEFTVSIPDERLEHSSYWFGLNGYDKLVKTIRLRIKKVYRGKEFQDTCISNISLKSKLSKEPKLGPMR